jgi:peptide/nickel transport system ATP-binding protein
LGSETQRRVSKPIGIDFLVGFGSVLQSTRSLLAGPKILICDEPTSALDVSIQAQILNLLKDLQARFGLTILFINHNVAVIRAMAAAVALLKDGKLVKCPASESFFTGPTCE